MAPKYGSSFMLVCCAGVVELATPARVLGGWASRSARVRTHALCSDAGGAPAPWDGVIDEEAHLGLDEDDGQPFVPAMVAPRVATPVPPGWDANDDNLEELVEWDVDEEWQAQTPVGNLLAPLASQPPDYVPPRSSGYVADWEVNEEAHFDFDDDDDGGE